MDEQGLTQRLLTQNRDEIDRADRKAVQGLAVAGTAAATVLGFMLGGNRPAGLLAPVQMWCWWAGCTLWIIGTVSLMLAVYPRVSGDKDVSLLAYFGHIGSLDRDQLVAALENAVKRSSTSVASELHWTSRIVIAKYRFVRVGLTCLCLAVIVLAPLVL